MMVKQNMKCKTRRTIGNIKNEALSVTVITSFPVTRRNRT
jgi:hypothetical protein